MLSLICTEAKSDTVTLSYNLRVDTASCILVLSCPTPFVKFLEKFTVTFDPSVPILDPTTVGLDVISLNRPYSSAFTYITFPEVGGEGGVLTVATEPLEGGGCTISDPSTYCTMIPVNPLSPYPAMHPEGVIEATSTGEIWSGNNVIPEPSTWVMIVLGFTGLGFAARRQRENFHA